MEVVFSQVLNMSLTASVAIVIVLTARLVLKNAPKIYSYALWSVVLFRLLCPISLAAPVSVLEVARPQVTRTEGITTSVSYIPASNVDPEPMKEIQSALSAQPQVESKKAAVEPITIVTWTWLAGAAIMFLRSMASYLQLHRRLIGAIPFQENVYLADHIPTPFVLGLFQPKIYLPSGIPSGERRYIISHERHHIRRGDHILKWLAYGALSIHWFNPLVWIAFVQAGKDMEMSCDEAVIKQLGSGIRADYSASLLRLATGQRIIAGTPLAFGEGDTKGRIRNMAKWKKPKVWVSALCLLLCLCILMACGMNPEGTSGAEVVLDGFHVNLPDYYSAEVIDDARVVFVNEEATERERIVGGLTRRISPFELKFGEGYAPEEYNGVEWLEALGIPEVKVWSYSITDSDNRIPGGCEALVIDCYPPDSEDFGKLHFLWFGEGSDVYDLWFDKNLIEEKAVEDIVDTAYLKASSEFDVEVEDLPAGYYVSTGEHDGRQELLFTDGTDTIGGVAQYPIPVGIYDPNDPFFAWLEEKMGIPDFEDATLCYLGGTSAPDGGWLVEFASDVPPGTEVTVDRRHHFYVVGDMVYDIWFDMLKVDFAVSEDIRKAVKLPGSPVAEPGEKTAEDLAFEKVKAIFDTVQSGAYQIQVWQENAGNEGPKAYLTTYFDDGENWLRLHEVLPEGINQTDSGDYYNRMAHLSHKGFHYSNDGHWGESGAIQWTAITQKDLEEAKAGRTSMLASFQWISSYVSYIDTLTDENGQCMMYRVDKKYADDAGYADHYFVNFYFDTEGNFKEAKLQVNLYQENEFTATESIVTLDTEEVAAQIDSYYSHGIPVPQPDGKPVVSGSDIVTNVELVQYGVMTMALPEGYSCREENGSVILMKDGADAGGITCWAAPNFELVFPSQSLQGSNMDTWIRALGLPEAQESDEPIGYMIGNGAYGDLDAEFFNELEPEKLNVEHEFFIVGDLVYDVYYDQNIISDTQAGKFLETITISGEPVVPPDPSEEDALAKCKAVLDMVQNGSYGISSVRKNTGSAFLNTYSKTSFWQSGENWLSMTEIPESGGSSFFWYMDVDGTHYNTERTGWDDDGPIWAEQNPVQVSKPWLATFQWSEEIVSYETTLFNGGEESVMLRIDEPYPYGEGNTECYYVTFKFVDGGAFLQAFLQVNPFRDNAFTETESILTLDTEDVATEIEKEFSRAVQ